MSREWRKLRLSAILFKMSADLRRSPRVYVPRLKVEVDASQIELTGNLSSGGVGFESKSPPEVGERIIIRVDLPDEDQTVELPAEVRHVHRSPTQFDSFYVGASFVGLDDLIQLPLDRFVEERSLRSAVAAVAAELLSKKPSST